MPEPSHLAQPGPGGGKPNSAFKGHLFAGHSALYHAAQQPLLQWLNAEAGSTPA